MDADREPPIRALFALRLFPGVEATFDERCLELEPLAGPALARVGVRRWVGFRLGTDVWVYGEYRDEPTASLVRLAEDADYGRWLRLVRDVVAEPAMPTLYEEIFHTDAGPRLGPPMEHGMLSIVIDPERAEIYDDLHAHPWPDLIAGLAGSGVRAYTGFRRGPHVVYYGEFYPDMRSAFGRMATQEVDARWGQALDGVITAIRGQDGWLLAAHEAFRIEAWKAQSQHVE